LLEEVVLEVWFVALFLVEDLVEAEIVGLVGHPVVGLGFFVEVGTVGLEDSKIAVELAGSVGGVVGILVEVGTADFVGEGIVVLVGDPVDQGILVEATFVLVVALGTVVDLVDLVDTPFVGLEDSKIVELAGSVGGVVGILVGEGTVVLGEVVVELQELEISPEYRNHSETVRMLELVLYSRRRFLE
jgi:hypothetical protein